MKHLSWKQAWRLPSFRIQAIVTVFAGILIAVFASPFLKFIQSVDGIYLEDPLLNYLPALDLSWYIFILLYSILALSIIQLFHQPVLLLKALQAYVLLTLMRGGCLFLFPLEPHKKIIPLADPFIDLLFYQQIIITKDLFFSGHVSTMTLIFLVNPYPFTKRIVGIFTLLLASFILLQHVHYTIDVLAAPLAAWFAYYLVSLYSFSIPVLKTYEVKS